MAAATGSRRHGAAGDELDLDVPPGTAVFDDETGELLADLVAVGQIAMIARGGRGGLGNTHFKTSTHQAPKHAQKGEPGEERWLRLELRLIADIGLVGLPNAGKSTLLAALTAATPKIADYPFTTLEPNLGVMDLAGRTTRRRRAPADDRRRAGADRGRQSSGAGLGHAFLRHVERTRILVHVVDGSGRDPEWDHDVIRDELEAHDPALLEKPILVVFNKLDRPAAVEAWPAFRDGPRGRRPGRRRDLGGRRRRDSTRSATGSPTLLPAADELGAPPEPAGVVVHRIEAMGDGFSVERARGRRLPRPRQADRADRRPDELRGRGIGRAVPARPRPARDRRRAAPGRRSRRATWSGSARPSSSGRRSPGRTGDGAAGGAARGPRRARSGSSAGRSTRSTSAISPSPGRPATSSGSSGSCRAGRPCRRTSRPADQPGRRPARDGRGRRSPASRGSRSSRIELDRPGRRTPSTRSRPLARSRARAGREPDLTVILSAESFAGLPTWHEPERLLDLARIAVAPRAGHPAPDPAVDRRRACPAAPTAIDRPRRPATSTSRRPTIRRRAAAGEPLDGPRPAGASRSYIDAHRLYRQPEPQEDRPLVTEPRPSPDAATRPAPPSTARADGLPSRRAAGRRRAAAERPPLDIARRIVELAEDKKAADIVLLDLTGLTTLADAFVICSGGSERQLDAIADGVDRGHAGREGPADRPRGDRVVALGPASTSASVVVHVFTPPERDYYSLEKHWAEAQDGPPRPVAARTRVSEPSTGRAAVPSGHVGRRARTAASWQVVDRRSARPRGSQSADVPPLASDAPAAVAA